MRRQLAAGTLVQAMLLSSASVAAWVAIQGAAVFHGEVCSVFRPTGVVRGLALFDEGRAAIFAGAVYSPVSGPGPVFVAGVYDLTTDPPRLKHRFEGVDAWRVCAGRQHGFVCARDGGLYVYDAHAPGPSLRRLGRHDFRLASVLQCPDDGSIVFVSSSAPQRMLSEDDSSLVHAAAAWDRQSGVRLWHRSDIAVSSSAFMPAGARMFVGLEGGAVLELEPASGATVRQIDRLPGRVCALSVAPGGDRLIFGDLYGNVAVTELSTGRRLWSRRHGTIQCQFAWRGQNVVIATGSKVALVCSQTGQSLAAIGELRLVAGVATAASGEVYACDRGNIVIWNPDAEQAYRVFSPTRDWTSVAAILKR